MHARNRLGSVCRRGAFAITLGLGVACESTEDPTSAAASGSGGADLPQQDVSGWSCGSSAYEGACTPPPAAWSCARSEYHGAQYWTCGSEDHDLHRCEAGKPVVRACPDGCQGNGLGHDDTCKPPAGGIPNSFGNRYGIGLIDPGSASELEAAANLAGPGGFVRLTFADITRAQAGPLPEWVAAVNDAYARDLIPVLRLGPPWGDRAVRDQSDDANRTQYTALAAAFRRVVQGLPKRPGWPLWVEIHNEPNLCYEWACAANSTPSHWLDYTVTAAEYAALLRDAADALHAIGDPRIKVVNAGLAPGGARSCECEKDGFVGGVTSKDFIVAMKQAVPGVFAKLDGWASHAYPAQGEGWGFFVPYGAAMTGLKYYEAELATVGKQLPVLITETGWTTDGGHSRQDIAAWTVSAYGAPWLTAPEILGVMPFQLQGGGWESFAWLNPSGGHYPVYDAVRQLRCTTIAGRCN